MARSPELKGDAIYETPVYSYGKKYYVTGRYLSPEAARKDARNHFRGRITTREPKLIKKLDVEK
jgi:hypothetical protein